MKFNICNLFLIFMLLTRSVTAQTGFEEYKFTGKVGTSPIELTFVEPVNFYERIEGYYFYTKFKKLIQFRGEDGVFSGRMELREFVDGKSTGIFVFHDLNYTSNLITGRWYTMDRKKSYEVVLYRKPSSQNR